MTAGVIALSDGSLFYGKSVSINGYATGELIFNTSMTGYQEILTDPSYYQQIITFTAPHIGNVGINSEDMESSRVWAKGIIVRDIAANFSNWRGQKNLIDFLKQQQILALTEIDTRRLTQLLRKKGNLFACLLSGSQDSAFALQQAKMAFKSEPASLYKTQKLPSKNHLTLGKCFHVAVIDCGVKASIIGSLIQMGCKVTVVSDQISFVELKALNLDGIVLSNGPGNPKDYHHLISLTQEIIAEQLPLFAICLGHQILALALGAKIYKMPFGQHGSNHPVYDIAQKRFFISSQNHNFAVSAENLPNHLKITHYSLIDKSIAGLNCLIAPAFSFQGHPEASPGPREFNKLFIEFVNLIKEWHA